MSDPIVRRLALDDLDDALQLSTVAGWNQRSDDWRMLLRLAPAGAFAAVLDARVIGTSIGIDYGGFGWIAMMLVDPVHRGRGVGRRLLKVAMDAIPSDLPIRLDATPLGRPLYQRHGFEDEAALNRYVIDGAALVRRSLGEGGRARLERDARNAHALTEEELDAVIEQDRETFGGTRGALLEWAFHAARHYAFLVRDADGVTHYCFGRQGRLFDQIGPVVAADDETAIALLEAALAESGDRRVAVDAFDRHGAFGAALRARGFVIERPLIRMCRPVDADTRRHDAGRQGVREFAIFGPEFA